MSFGGGFSGFGQSNNNNTASSNTFGFGQNNNNNTSTGFGATNTTTPFGQSNTTGGGMFGSTNNTATTNNAFGGSGGAFGSTTNSAFGSKPAFGASTTGGSGLFGGGSNTTPQTNTTSGFGGFGASNNTTSSPFGGGSNTTGGLFGGNSAAKPAFGTSNSTGNLFGGGATNTASTGFGATPGGFGGATSNPGLGATGGDPPGTGVTPFQAHTEKEQNSTTGMTNAFQNILFQDPYKKWSTEELRLVDYAQGRRQGNGTGGTTGGFGSTSGFGFGSTQQAAPTTGFGANNNASGGNLFGANNTASNTTSTGFGGFGSNTAANSNNQSGGLFGAKPAGGNLFGSNNQPQQTTGFGGGASTGFGASNTGSTFGQSNTNTSTGLFGANNQAQKPAGSGFSFGNTNTTTTQTTGFGGATSTGFGANNTQSGTTGLFGNTNTQTANTGTGLFGNNNQQQQQQQGTTGGFGGFGQQNQNQNQQSTGLFGSQQKPAGTGLFGNTGTAPATGGTGLFGAGNNNQQQTTGGFGGGASTGSGLFGAAKPAAPFGQTNNTQAAGTGGGLFGSIGNNQQNQQATGMFGQNNQQQKPSLFGNSAPAGGGLFGGQNNQSQGLGFGNSTNQQQNTGFASSLLNNSQQASNAPQGLTANLNDVSAYGSPSLFAGVGGNETPNPGPLATPVNGNKPRRGSILPLYKMAPSTSSRFSTPQKRGFGFSYSTYGTPVGSPTGSNSSTPGTLGRSLLGSSVSGGLSKSISASNLRRSYNTEDSILAPGAFSASSASRIYGSTGSKKLIINREIRSDLFSTPQKDRAPVETNTGSRKLAKRVSFDTSNVENEEGTPLRALPAPESSSPHGEETPRQSKTLNGANGSKAAEPELAKSKELTVVHEEVQVGTPEVHVGDGFDNVPGDYWMKPSYEELQAMNRVQRQKVDGFTVGRENVGSITFKVPVDLSNIDIDEICGGIIDLVTRSATVYPISAKKPPVGKGLNVPARISLEQSWPRSTRDKRITTDPKRLKKHVDKLKLIPDTTFEDYEMETGIWTFSVEHFTTYGLDDSDDESDEGDVEMEPPVAYNQSLSSQSEESVVSQREDDTFSFKQRKMLPGGFDEQEDIYGSTAVNSQSFLGVSSADSAPNDVHLSLDAEGDMGEEYELSDDEEMATSPVGQHLAAEHDVLSPEDEQEAKRATPGGVLRARMRAMKDSVGPVRLEVADGDDWMEMLRKTVSPVKRDRQLLRELNDSPLKRMGQLIDFDNDGADENLGASTWKRSTMKDRIEGLAAGQQFGRDNGRGFATSIDLMNSLFEKPRPAVPNVSVSGSKGFPKVGTLVNV
jgi:nuclear pore complex protein Nup98-Nup96